MPQITSKTRSDFSLVAALSHGFYLAFFAAFLLLNPLIIVYAKEVALVVGNSSYSKEPIAGLSSHAQSLVADLNAQGFEVFPAIDAGHFEIKKAVEDFSFAAEEAEFAFVYLGGHSLKLKYSYFVPTDATLESRSDRPKLIKLKDIYKAAAGASNAALVFDFCHSHEFAAGWGESAGRAPVCSSKDLKLRPQKNTVSLLNRTTVIEASRWSNATINSLRDSMVEGAEPSTLLATLERKFVDSGATLLKRGEMDYKLGSLKEESSDLQYEQSVVSSIKQEFSPPDSFAGKVDCEVNYSQRENGYVTRVFVRDCKQGGQALVLAIEKAVLDASPLPLRKNGTELESRSTVRFVDLVEPKSPVVDKPVANVSQDQPPSKPETPALTRLTVTVIPEDANIRILNIKPSYQDGIELAKGGAYHLEVTKIGFLPQSRWIKLSETNNEQSFTLKPAPETNEQNIAATNLQSPGDAGSSPVATPQPVVISDSDKEIVFKKLEVVTNALKRGDVSQITSLIASSGKRQLLVDLLGQYESIDAELLSLSTNRSSARIEGVLLINSMTRANGDLARPGRSYRTIDFYSTRNTSGDWSQVNM